MKIRAPAKINLTLRVVGKRPDGYHLLDTIMLPVSLFDDVVIRKARRRKADRGNAAPPIRISCDHPLVPCDESNLVYKAAALLIRKQCRPVPVEIHIRKRIPVGAGLGGGSSDAAATLLGLNKMLKLRLASARLEKIGLTIGADVPFFIRRLPARAQGIGEVLTPLRGVPRFWLIIVYPGVPISTSWVYRKLSPKLTKLSVNTSIIPSLNEGSKLDEVLVNDLEAVAIKRHPRIGVIKKRLLSMGAEAALMSGSGSSVFGIFRSRRRAQEAFRRLRQEEGAQTFLVRVLS